MELNYIFGDMPQEERLKNLRSLAVKMEKGTYSRTLTEEEILAEEKDYIRKSMDLTRLKAEAKESQSNYKAKIDGISDELEEGLKRINNQKREIVGTLFSIPDHSSKVMRIYDAYGELIDKRPLKPEELQGRAFIEGPNGETKTNPDEIQDAEIIRDPETLEGAIEQMNEGEPTIAGSAKPEARWEGEIAEEGSEILQEDSNRGDDQDWTEFYTKKDEEFKAKQEGDNPKKRRTKKDDKNDPLLK